MPAIRNLPSDVFITRWLPRIIEAVMVLLMAWVAAGWLTGGAGGMRSSPGMVRQAVHERIPLAEDIASIPLFGKAVKDYAPARQVPVVTMLSRLRLRLLGTMQAGASSAAIIALESGNGQKLVFVGDAIKPGVVLTRVEASAIEVDNHGRLERILMKKMVLAGAAPTPIRDNGGVRHISRAVVDAQLNDLPVLLTQARAIPHQTNGKPDGFLIQEIVPGSLYDQAGLKNGDVIRKVNGQPITRPEQGIKLFQSLRNANGIDLEIARNGVTRTVHFDIR